MIFGALERWIALRYLRARRKEGFISVIAWFSLLGIALGVATLIIVMSVMNGFRAELLGRILGVNGHLTIYSNIGGIEDYQDVRQRVEAIPGVVLATPQIQSQVMVTAGAQARGAVVRALEPGDFARRDLLRESFRQGDFRAFEAGEGLLIGSRLAQSLGVRPGSQISLVTPRGNATAIGTIPRIKSYPVAGIFDVGMFEYDSSFIFMPLPLAQTYFRLPEQANAIEVFVEDVEEVRGPRRAIEGDLGGGFRTVDWQNANASFFNAVKVERNVMFLILTLIILVAAFNIISGQIMLVKDKGRDIAILRTMGATRGMILRIFFMSGASIGVIGTLAGLLLGYVFVDNIAVLQGWVEAAVGTQVFNPEIYFLTTLPAVMDPQEVVEVVLMALAIAFCAPLFPAWRAARLDPVEALRYE